MELHPTKIPNAVTFIFDHGASYTYFLDFKEGESFAEITDRLSNPMNWTGVFVSAGDDNLHFINLTKVRQVYFSVLAKEKIEAYKEKVYKNLERSDGIGFGILVPEEDKRPHPKMRVKNIPKI